jgi:hypothetical protein
LKKSGGYETIARLANPTIFRRLLSKKRPAHRPPNAPSPLISTAQTSPQQPLPRADIAAAAILAGTLFILYLATMPPGVTFEDTALFAAVCYLGGVAHPPGYPLHSMLCYPFARLADLDFLQISPAMGAAIFSAFAAALAAAAVFAALRMLSQSRIFAFALAAAFGAGARFWSQAILPEVYSLNALFVFATFALALRYRQLAAARIGEEKRRRRLLVIAALTAGLGLANHWPLYLLCAPAFVLALPAAVAADLRRLPVFAAAAFALFLGLTPYLYLFARASSEVFSLIGEVDDWRRFVWYVGREEYTGREPDLPGAGFAFAGFALRLQAAEHAYLGAALGIAGMLSAWRRWDKALFFAVLWGASASGALLALILNPEPDALSAAIFSVYPLPAFGFWIFFIGEGLRAALAGLSKPAGIIAALGFALIVAAVNYPANQRRGDDLAERYARLVLNELPPNATLVVGGDWSFPFLYFREALGLRPDINLHIGPDIKKARASHAAGARFFQIAPPSNAPFESRRSFGLYEEEVSGGGLTITPAMADFCLALAARSSQANGWNRMFRHFAMFSLGRDLAIFYKGDTEPPPHIVRLRAAVADTQAGSAGAFIARGLGLAGKYTPRQTLRAFSTLEEKTASLPAEWRARMLHLNGIALLRLGDLAAAKAAFAKAADIFPSVKSNLAIIDLLQVMAARGEWQQYRQTRRRFAGLDAPKALNAADAACARHFNNGAPCTD